MICTENYMMRDDGVALLRTYSDAGLMIERNGEIYEEAVDPEGLGRMYAETDVKIDRKDAHVDVEIHFLTEKAAAYDILMGNEVAE